MPLNLVNPESPDFSAQGCRTFHDIIHFCHEKAVDELAHFQEHRPGLGAIRTRRMNLGVPMDIRVLDIGGGMTTPATDEPTADEARSEPFSIFLEGLLNPQAWATELPSLGLRDILSSMPRSMGMLSESVDSLGENLAIVSHDYMNVSLRLGYHFSVIDAHLGSDGSRNYVYFRFAGGLADPERRGRRATFISDVLKAMDFKVSMKGDLVIGRLKSAESATLRSALSILGALTAFSRQRDTGLYSDADTNALFILFASTFLSAFNRTIPSVHDQPEPESVKTADPGNSGKNDDTEPLN
jgi:pyruvate,water dikinase